MEMEDLVKTAKKMKSQGYKYSDIAELFNAKGFKTRNNNDWTDKRVSSLIYNGEEIMGEQFKFGDKILVNDEDFKNIKGVFIDYYFPEKMCIGSPALALVRIMHKNSEFPFDVKVHESSIRKYKPKQAKTTPKGTT